MLLFRNKQLISNQLIYQHIERKILNVLLKYVN